MYNFCSLLMKALVCHYFIFFAVENAVFMSSMVASEVDMCRLMFVGAVEWVSMEGGGCVHVLFQAHMCICAYVHM